MALDRAIRHGGAPVPTGSIYDVRGLIVLN